MPARDEESITNQTSEDDRSTVVTYSEAVVPSGAFGAKTIGMIPGLALNINNVTGPGMVQMPQVAATGGWIPTTLMVMLSFFLSSFSSTMMLEAIKRMPGNSKFEQRIEFTTLAKHFFRGRHVWAYYATLFVFMMSFQTTLIASVIESSQTTDSCFIEIFGKSCALQLHNNESIHTDGSSSFGFRCVGDGEDGSGDSPFGNDAYVISLGFAFVLMIALPLGYWNLDDNINVQVVACAVLFVIVAEWVVQSFVRGLVFDPSDHQISEGYGGVPVAKSNLDDIFGIVLFNYAFVTTLPSWVNEKKVGVPINKSVWYASGIGTAMFLLVGILCAAAYDFTGSSDLLAQFTNSSTQGSTLLTRIMAYLFPFSALVSGIPIQSIIIRYNLLENNICRTAWANFWGGVFPWLMSIVLYTGSALNDITKWSGLLIIVPLNFALPVYFYIRALRDGEDYTEGSEGEDTALLAEDERNKDHEAAKLRTYATSDDVDVWIPGHQWVLCTIMSVQHQIRDDVEDVNGESVAHITYTVRPKDGKIAPRDVVAENIRIHGEDATGAVHTHLGSLCVVEEHPNEKRKPQTVCSPPTSQKTQIILQQTEQIKLDKLQVKLDQYEQDMADLRAEIKVFVTQFAEDSEQQQTKRLHQQEIIRLQRKVDKLIQKMEDIRAQDAEGDDTMLTSAQVDELFTALPTSWSTQRKMTMAWTMIAVSIVLNVTALIYNFAG